jgi:hypothetical protein
MFGVKWDGGLEMLEAEAIKRHIRSSPLNLCLNLGTAQERHALLRVFLVTAPICEGESRLPLQKWIKCAESTK